MFCFTGSVQIVGGFLFRFAEIVDAVADVVNASTRGAGQMVRVRGEGVLSAFGALEKVSVGRNGIPPSSSRAHEHRRRELEPLPRWLEETVERGQPFGGDQALEQAEPEVGHGSLRLDGETC